MDDNSVKILNPWWDRPESIHDDLHIRQVVGKPYYFDNPIKKDLEIGPGRSFLLRGGRQVGKTTLLKEKILEAIRSRSLKGTHCLYLSCEAALNFQKLQEILTRWISSHGKEPLLICLDEITFVPEWQRAILWLINAGLLQNATTLITGSNARDLQKMAERFPGRRVKEIKIHPFSLADYRAIECFRSLNPEETLKTYLRVGGFPHAVRDYHQFGSVSDETYETYANWIFGDAHRFRLSRDVLIHILFRIYDTIGTQVTWQRLVEKSPVKSHETAAAYVEHLELAFLCDVLSCYDPSKEMASPRRPKKIYFVDPLLYGVVGAYLRGIRNGFVWWLAALSEKDFGGKIFEAVVVTHYARSCDPLYYWYSTQQKREVDLLVKKGGDISLLEVRSQPQEVKPALGRTVKVITPENFIECFYR